MRYYLTAGEHSGDLHGADLIQQIQQLDPDAHFWACGGPAMQQAMGKACAVDPTQMASIGLDFLKKVHVLWRIFRFCKSEMVAYNPHAVILIDYGGFNLRLADFAKKHGFRVYYYIPPKIWAHGAKRIEKIKKTVAHVASTLPFEVEYYRSKGYTSIAYVGNPLVQKVARHKAEPAFRSDHGLDDRPIVALLPGSRLGEIRRILPPMAKLVDDFPEHQLVVAGVPHIPSELYAALAPAPIRIVCNRTHALLAAAQIGVIACGSASLEAALLDLPQVVVYKTNFLTYWLYKTILTVPHISLVNLLMDAAVVPELVQNELNPQNLRASVRRLLEHTHATAQKRAYDRIRTLLGTKNAAQETARMIATDLKQHFHAHENESGQTG